MFPVIKAITIKLTLAFNLACSLSWINGWMSSCFYIPNASVHFFSSTVLVPVLLSIIEAGTMISRRWFVHHGQDQLWWTDRTLINVRKTQILNKNGCRSRESRICCLPCTYPYPKKYVLCIRWNSLFVAAQNEWQHPVSVPWGWLQAANLRQGRTMCLCQKFITELWANCSNMHNPAILSWWTCQNNAAVTWLIPPIFVSAEYLAEDIHQKNTGQPEHLCDLMLNHMFCDLKN